jgi:hypothetical protein
VSTACGITGGGGTFKRWDLVGGSELIWVMPLKEILGSMVPSHLSLLPGHHEVTTFASLCMMFAPNIKTSGASWGLVTHACNPTYSGGRDQEDHGWSPAWANRSIVCEALYWKKLSQKRKSGVVQGVDPEFQPQYCKQNKTKWKKPQNKAKQKKPQWHQLAMIWNFLNCNLE